MRALTIGSLVAASAVIGCSGSPSPTTSQGDPVVLLLHPGGFVYGTAASMDAAAKVARGEGLSPVEVHYPLGSPSKAVNYSARVARSWQKKGHIVYAYGESAGGAIAAKLAERGVVDRAAVQAPVSNIPNFFESLGVAAKLPRGWRADALNASPVAQRSRHTIRAWVPRQDQLSRDTWRWINKDPHVTGTAIPGGHLEQPYSIAAMKAALRYLGN